MRRPLLKPVIRPATREDIIAFHGKPYPFTSRAVVGLVRGRRIAIGGVGDVDGRLFAFYAMKPSARRYKVSIVKAAAAVIEAVKADGAKFIWAIVDPKEPGSRRWVEAMGFKPTVTPHRYRWARGGQNG